MAKNPSGGPNGPSDLPPDGDGGERRTAPRPNDIRPASADAPAERASPAGKTVGQRKQQFLIAPRQAEGLQTFGVGLQPLSLSSVEQVLRANDDIEIVDTVGPRNAIGALADGMGGATQGVLVARMTLQKAGVLHQQAQGRLVVERDQPLNLMDPSFHAPGLVTSFLPNTGPVLATVILVLGKDGAPLADAEVSLFGSMLPASGVTDNRGQVNLSLFGETPASIRGLYVKPKADYWSFYQRDPEISTDEANVVQLRALSDWPSLAGFPRQKAYGWGQKAMRLDQLPGNYRGQGIRIAIIDSGAATSHDNLSTIRAGFDILNKKVDPGTWNVDTLGHGSHCAGVIAAADIASGLRGFAPDAEIHACKLFPGGQVSQLIDALEYCIDKQIDVVNLSLGGADVSEALEQQILRAKRAGIACIVAAGNSGGAVQYPASSPNVLAVAAIGKLDEFPPDSYHAETLTQNVDANGYFSAKFSCYGPQVGVCGPGVAIASTVPPNNFAAWDGTSMATPHITGLAALVLAHHPDFQSMYRTRGAERVERLFQVIRASARRIALGDQSRTGYGLPDAMIAVGLQTPAGQAQPHAAAPQSAGAGSFGSMGTMGNAIGAAIGGMGGAMGSLLPQQVYARMPQMEPFAIDPALAAYAAYVQSLPYGAFQRGGW